MQRSVEMHFDCSIGSICNEDSTVKRGTVNRRCGFVKGIPSGCNFMVPFSVDAYYLYVHKKTKVKIDPRKKSETDHRSVNIETIYVLNFEKAKIVLSNGRIAL